MKFWSWEQMKLFCMASSSEIRGYSYSKALSSVAVRTQLRNTNRNTNILSHQSQIKQNSRRLYGNMTILGQAQNVKQIITRLNLSIPNSISSVIISLSSSYLYTFPVYSLNVLQPSPFFHARLLFFEISQERNGCCTVSEKVTDLDSGWASE